MKIETIKDIINCLNFKKTKQVKYKAIVYNMRKNSYRQLIISSNAVSRAYYYDAKIDEYRKWSDSQVEAIREYYILKIRKDKINEFLS